MAGHSKWHNIRLRKGKQDAVRGKTFTKLAKEIIIAAKEGGGNPDANMRLKTAVDAARKMSMPADNIKRAIQRGTGEIEGISYVERTLEGYAPGGVAVMVQCLTDNQQRTVADVRAIFTKSGGNMGEAGSVSYLFQHKGIFVIDPGVTTEDQLMEAALDAGLEEILPSEDGGFEVTCAFADFGAVHKALDAAKIPVATAETTMVPITTIALNEADTEKLLKMVDRLEEHDDVQNVYFNLEATEDELAAV
jgi:YebC/PmpR family DNA-binding regulatory protein